MISRSLYRRLQQLEAHGIPTGEPMVIEVVFVSPGGEQQSGPVIELPPIILRGNALSAPHRPGKRNCPVVR
jgi:hypothetical protein